MKNLSIVIILSTLLISCVPDTKQFQDVETGEIIVLQDTYDLAMFDTLIVSRKVHSHLPTKVEIWGIYNDYVPESSFNVYYSVNSNGDTTEYVSSVTYQLVTEVKQ